ncbi:MAG: sigma 54-interacting transcriptional regulator [Planctomycetaceae bacterium]|nr:sigma 54-interacting transcriptional regulator [Planctomycetaceae bacterium]
MTDRLDLDFHRNPAILTHVIDAMADGLFTVDAQGTFIAWSEGAERITGYSREEIEGQPCSILEGQNCKGFATLKNLLQTSQPCATNGICNQECKLLSKDGREIYILGNVRLFTDAQGNTIGAVGCFTDLTSFVLSNERIALLEEQNRQRNQFSDLIGKSDLMQEVFRRLRLAGQSDVSVFISGESGTGKELAARAIHQSSSRAKKPFIAVNCSAIPETLLESELFGHVKGAFTGAIHDKIGLFQAADGGTLFLDEIGDLSPMLQLKLLRVLQEREVHRVGDDLPHKVDVRLITATNRDLKSLIRDGSFREDFYYRIHVFEIRLPSLRERKEDIPLLVQHFLEEFSRQYGRSKVGIARDALAQLMDHNWPGNIRELRNAIEHAFVTLSGDRVMLVDLPLDVRKPASFDHSQRTAQPVPRLDSADSPSQELSPEELEEKRQLTALLEEMGGNKTAAAKRLGVSRVTMWKKTRKYGL